MLINGSVNQFDLTDEASPGSASEMGRPPLGMKPTTVRLSLDTIHRIEARVGNRRLAVFIREAVENELSRRENREQLDE
jgi:hypothetical protein